MTQFPGQSETFFMGKIIGSLRVFFGLTKRGNSALGRILRESIRHTFARRMGGIALVGLILAFVAVENFANVGGVIAISINPSSNTQPVINAETIPAIQSPIEFTYESRGISFFHAGTDLVAPVGTAVYPIMPGTVTLTGSDPFGYGNHVVVKHEDGYESLYAHLSKISVKIDDRVQMSSELGKSGSTGFSTGPHLHLEVRYEGQIINPAEIVPTIK